MFTDTVIATVCEVADADSALYDRAQIRLHGLSPEIRRVLNVTIDAISRELCDTNLRSGEPHDAIYTLMQAQVTHGGKTM